MASNRCPSGLGTSLIRGSMTPLIPKAKALSNKQTNSDGITLTAHSFQSVMSVDARKKDFWQSASRSTIKDRCKSIFNQEFLSDVKFVVPQSQGGSKIKIPAHKLVLVISSPVFYAMFYGELAETKDSVEISDCEYESLLELFRFIYSDEANLTPDNVMQLMYLAKKYMLPSLADKCSAYLQENLDASNVFIVLPDAQKYEEKDLLDRRWKVIEKKTEEAVKSDGFVTIERSILEEMVEKDSLNIKEVELFKAVDRWAGKECEKQGLVAEGTVKRRILGERIVKGIRFPVAFVGVVLDCDILTKKECFDMMKYFSALLTIPVEFSGQRRTGQLNVISRFCSLSNGWGYSPGICNSIRLCVGKDVYLHSVRLFGSENGEYSVRLSVINPSGVSIINVNENFLSKLIQSEMGNYYGFEIDIKPPAALQGKKEYRFIANITGPPSWYGLSGKPTVQHSGVKFTFRSDGGFTDLNGGQFPEFILTMA